MPKQRPQTAESELRVDELAREAGVATTTIRLYQSKGLLAGPRMVGRTGFYGPAHLARLHVIARLQERGFSLAGIGELIASWEQGGELSDLVGAEEQLGGLLGQREEVVLDGADLFARFPADSLEPALVQRAAALGLVEATEDGRFRVFDVRFLDTGAALATLGVPLDAVLDEWEQLAEMTAAVAERFASVFERFLLPADWRTGLDRTEAHRLADTLGQLRSNGERIVLAALDDAIAKLAAARFGELLDDA